MKRDFNFIHLNTVLLIVILLLMVYCCCCWNSKDHFSGHNESQPHKQHPHIK